MNPIKEGDFDMVSDFLQKHQFLGKVLLIVLSSSLALISAEVILRKITLIDRGTTFEHRVPHPVLGWISEPGITYRNRVDEEIVSISYNLMGFRDREHSLEKPDGVFRIVVLGDSYMEAYSVDLSQAFHSKIEELAKRSGRRVEVINLGVGGYNTLQEYLALQNIGRLYAPDVVVLAFYSGNDVKDNSRELVTKIDGDRARRRPYLEQGGPSDWTITEADFAAAQSRFQEARSSRGSLIDTLKQNSVIVKILHRELARLFRQIETKVVGNNIKKGDVKSLSASEKDMVENGIYYCKEPVEYTRAWEITKRILSRLKQDIIQSGGKFVVVSVPAQVEVELNLMEKRMTLSVNPALMCLDAPPSYNRLRDILGKLEIDYVDLLPEFRYMTREKGKTLFRRSDRHWNPDGHALAAEKVYSALKDKGLLTEPQQ